MSKRINLLNGSIFLSLTKLAIPIMLTSLIQMAYNMTDMIWIGRIGSGAVAAVGSASMYSWLSQGVATFARMGGQVKAAQSFGAGDYNKSIEYAQNSLQLGTVLGIVYSIIMAIFSKPLFSFFNLHDPQVINYGEIYLFITGSGLIFSFLNQILTGLITATGNSRTPFLATTAGLIVNIVLDPVLIYGYLGFPEMGVAGAAIATVIAQAIVFAFYIVYTTKDDLLFKHVKIFAKPEFKKIKEIAKIGFPTALQGMCFTFIAMIIGRIVANFGDAGVAVQRVGSQIEAISWMTADGFAVAINSFIAQNYGANNIKRAHKGYYTSLKTITAWGFVAMFILLFFAEPLFKIFIPDPKILPLGKDYLVIIAFSQVMMCIEIITTGALAGFGKTLGPSISETALTAARIPMALVFGSIFGLNGIWWSLTTSSILKGLTLLIMYWCFARKHKTIETEITHKDDIPLENEITLEETTISENEQILTNETILQTETISEIQSEEIYKD